ncbi:type II secretion system minor pseudopilin GspK [Vibrio ostreicida]|uniref:Type II secretion system protein K n=1 Tax=Vibrio ostreicida TaxID=526588 RepID=A0ABT8BQ44_9VIBR|nr:type II secretion system minor pseudopilin GspK [Vibrio ostreicida]MDN3608556.1 type II secretion system minor pseudopilin GspK [Vibrio ostreicida]NPD10688.1 type II secretion system minor pseudopilin GspK [Vibrio ostreicida]
MRAKQSQRGVALIVILLLLAVMVSMAASMADRLFSQFKRASNQINYQQAYWYSLGVEALAKKGIEQSYKDNDESINLSQPWAKELSGLTLDYGTLNGKMYDAQACFNLNALAEASQTTGSTQPPFLVEKFQHLLEELEVDNYQSEIIAQSVWEYVDSNDSVNASLGVEDSYYESLSPAYLSANTLMADSSELRAINQVGGDVMEKVKDYVCALPTSDFRLNVNTLSVEHAALLTAMFYPNLSTAQAKQVLENRGPDGWASINDFFSQSALSDISADMQKKVKGYLTVDSAYFELDAEVLVDKSRVRIRSLLFSNNRETATVVRRRFGGISERVSNRSAEQK